MRLLSPKWLSMWLTMCGSLTLCVPLSGQEPPQADPQHNEQSLPRIERSVIHSGFDGETCWVHARVGYVPSDAAGKRPAQAVMTTQQLLLSGSDVFSGLHSMQSTGVGNMWSPITACPRFRRQVFGHGDTWSQSAAVSEQKKKLVQAGDEVTVCDFVPQWHPASQRLLGIGQTVWYRQNRVASVRPRSVAYAVYDPTANQESSSEWSEWRMLQLPDERKFLNAGAGSAQRVDLPGGDILLPIYFKEPEETQYSVTVCRCRFDGQRLEYVEHGNELTLSNARGLYEPSLVQWNGRYYLTLRNDENGYVTTSDDGLHFDDPITWRFDDGSDLGNYNTQQHWVSHASGLYLVYTRRGADNDHVFRHRAPLFMARVDPDTLSVMRHTEVELVANRGARLGNFGVTQISPHETWVTVAEWMQPAGVEQYGSDNSIHLVKVKFAELSTPTTHTDQPSAWKVIAPYFQPPAAWQNDYGAYRSPLIRGDGSLITTAAEWMDRRKQLLSEWEELLGKWPPLIDEPQVEFVQSTSQAGYVQHRVRFEWIPGEHTEGWLLVPLTEGPHPAVLSVFYEPETAIGQGSSPHRDFALQLVQRGFVCLSIGTTEATQARTYSLYYPSLEEAQVQPLSMLGCAAANSWYVLASLPDVDDERIGVVGHSFGGKWAMFAACLFEQFACGAWSDPGIVFDDTRGNVNYWEPWYLGYHPPPWRQRGMITVDNPAQGLYPRLRESGRDLHELHALMAPRPFLVSGGAEDGLERWQALNHSVAVNRLLGFEGRVAMTNRPDHSPNADSNSVLCAFFEHFLAPK